VPEFNAYLKKLASAKPAALTCPQCGARTISTSGNDTFCNFCEQYVNAGEGAEILFASVHAGIKAGDWEGSTKKVEQLLKTNTEPRLLYLSAVFYDYFSDIRYNDRNYNLQGFMEANAENIGKGVELASLSKNCFYKALKLTDTIIKGNSILDPNIFLIKFLSEMRLGMAVDAMRTLSRIKFNFSQSPITRYANLVYGVETNSKEAEALLSDSITRGQMNAFYYLAKYLAKRDQIDEAYVLLQKFNKMVESPIARELTIQVISARNASEA